MVRIRVQYDGKVLIPDRPLELPRNVPLNVTVGTDEQMCGDDLIQKLIDCSGDLWKGVDGLKYQRKQREGWE